MEEPIRDPEVMARAKVLFDLYEFSVRIMEGNLRRRFPSETDEEIERRLAAWLIKLPEEAFFGEHPPDLDLGSLT